MANDKNADSSAPGLGTKVVSSTALLLTMRWTVRLIGLFSTIVLARLLTPVDFGVVAIAVSYMGIILGVTDLNISQAIIQFRQLDDKVYNTAWTLGIIRGFLIAVVIIASAVPVSRLMGDPRLIPVIIILAATPFVYGFENPYFVNYEKELDYKKLAVLELLTKVTTVVITIVIAIIYKNYWALVVGTLCAALLKVILSFVFLPTLPRFSLSAARRIIGFTLWLSGNRILTEVNTRLFNFVVGAVAGLGAAGKYHMSIELSALINEIKGPLSRVLYSAYSKLNDDTERLAQAFLVSTSVLYLVVLPAGVGMALISHDFIFVLLGESWIEIAPYFALLCLSSGVTSIVSSSDSMLIALGKQKFVFYRELSLTAFTVIALVVASIQGSLLWFVAARSLSGIFWAATTLVFVAAATSKNTVLALWQNIWRAVLSVLVMSASVIVAGGLMEHFEGNIEIIARLVVTVGVGAITYSTSLVLLWKLTGKPNGPEQWILQNLASFKRKRDRSKTF